MVANRLSMPEEVEKSFIFNLSGFSEELFQSQKIAHLINSWMCLYILENEIIFMSFNIIFNDLYYNEEWQKRSNLISLGNSISFRN
jgi:hypothetical protein